MHADAVAIATITWPRSDAEEQLLLRASAVLAGSGFRVVVAERGSSQRFAAALSAYENFTVTTVSDPGLVPQVKASLGLAAASGKAFILYVEPDKEAFFRRALHAFIGDAPDGADVGIVIAGRSAESFRTYPAMQRYTEDVINHLCAEMLQCAGDYSYGPFLINRHLLPHLARTPDRLGWGWRHYAFMTAHRLGYRVLHLPGDYPCPPDQRDESSAERTHRLRQLSENLLGLIHPDSVS